MKAKRHTWQLQEAKNKLSEVVDEARRSGAQVITRRGVEEAVVLSFDEYRRLVSRKSSLVAFFRSSPLSGVALDLDRGRDLGREIDL